MSKQLLEAAITAKDILESVAYWMMNPDSITSSADGVYLAIAQLDAAITIAQRQDDMQAADAYEAQFAPIESFDSAEGSPICPECGAIMETVYSGNENVIGYKCMDCDLADYFYSLDVEEANKDE